MRGEEIPFYQKVVEIGGTMAETEDLDDIEENLSADDEMLPADGEGYQEAVSADLEDEESENVTSAAHLDEQLEEDAGVTEALQAWSEGGHVEEELDDIDEVAPIQFAQLDDRPVMQKERSDRLHNVEVEITVELGRSEMTVKELVNLKEQDFIELNKLAGEAFTILINKRPFAEGEIVVVPDIMAVRITRLMEYARESGEGN